MASLNYSVYKEVEDQSHDLYYSQAVIVGNIVKTSGQGGWDSTGNIPTDVEKQVELAFENVSKALRAANSGLSWDNVYAVRTLHTDIEKSADFVIAGFKKHMPKHRPIWTCVQIEKLGVEGMQVEIEVEAIL
ncbi:uncharacterized protein APUU_10020S [Aspergillus puulaauensis]|uniref:YjgF-like protein n=1 Tax=Aspergillus puulaauensis TaxID=1220207 RepID=A0A7R7X990_9EURO|nr:uncharacterized protein APUU_10020S [Aspergillus puulaauensis]BCS17192.1 hypothetical protein APUU_10020S [Aspergillus puulaauensis]